MVAKHLKQQKTFSPQIFETFVVCFQPSKKTSNCIIEATLQYTQMKSNTGYFHPLSWSSLNQTEVAI
jgi:hypothetical protein